MHCQSLGNAFLGVFQLRWRIFTPPVMQIELSEESEDRSLTLVLIATVRSSIVHASKFFHIVEALRKVS